MQQRLIEPKSYKLIGQIKKKSQNLKLDIHNEGWGAIAMKHPDMYEPGFEENKIIFLIKYCYND